jgi:hypothetical protein
MARIEKKRKEEDKHHSSDREEEIKSYKRKLKINSHPLKEIHLDKEIRITVPSKEDKEDQPYLICVNPHSKQHFRLNLDTYRFSYEPIRDDLVRDQLNEKVREDLKIINKLMTNK